MELLTQVHNQMDTLIGTGNFGETNKGTYFVEYPSLEYALSLDTVFSWTNRPGIKMANEKQAKPIIIRKASLLLHRSSAFHPLTDSMVLARTVELRLVPQARDLNWVYDLKTFRDQEEIVGIVSHYKNTEEYDSPVWGEFHNQEPNEDELIAFNRFLNAVSSSTPLRASLDRFTLKF